jgi:hypothetical protein
MSDGVHIISTPRSAIGLQAESCCGRNAKGERSAIRLLATPSARRPAGLHNALHYSHVA